VNANEPRDALQTLDKARSKFQPSFVNEYFTAMAYARMKDSTNALKHLVAAEVVARATDTNRLTHTFYFQLGAAYERAHKLMDDKVEYRRLVDAKLTALGASPTAPAVTPAASSAAASAAAGASR